MRSPGRGLTDMHGCCLDRDCWILSEARRLGLNGFKVIVLLVYICVSGEARDLLLYLYIVANIVAMMVNPSI